MSHTKKSVQKIIQKGSCCFIILLILLQIEICLKYKSIGLIICEQAYYKKPIQLIINSMFCSICLLKSKLLDSVLFCETNTVTSSNANTGIS